MIYIQSIYMTYLFLWIFADFDDLGKDDLDMYSHFNLENTFYSILIRSLSAWSINKLTINLSFIFFRNDLV